MAINNLDQKIVAITGASAGVGAACARHFASLGAKLVLIARGEQALKAMETELQVTTDVLSVAMDVADTAACDALIVQIIDKFGRLDVLINNAGLHIRGNVESRTGDDLAAMIDVNLRAPLYLSAKVLPLMIQTGAGAIVMVGSLAGRAPLQGAATYAASKAGLRAFAYALADEVREYSISVSVVSPGPIDTGFIMNEIDDVEDIVYSQPMSTAEGVAANIVELTRGERVEISMPKISGWLTTLSYLFPRLRRGTRSSLYAKGRKNKEKYRNANAQSE